MAGQIGSNPIRRKKFTKRNLERVLTEKEALKIEIRQLNALIEELEEKIKASRKKDPAVEKEKDYLNSKKTELENRFSQLNALELIIREALKRKEKKEEE